MSALSEFLLLLTPLIVINVSLLCHIKLCRIKGVGLGGFAWRTLVSLGFVVVLAGSLGFVGLAIAASSAPYSVHAAGHLCPAGTEAMSESSSHTTTDAQGRPAVAVETQIFCKSPDGTTSQAPGNTALATWATTAGYLAIPFAVIVPLAVWGISRRAYRTGRI